MNSLLLPDLLLLCTGFLVLGADLFLPRGARTDFHLAWAGALLVFFILFMLPHDQQALFAGGYQVNGRGLLFKQLFALSAAFTILLADSHFRSEEIKRRLAGRGEFCAIVLFATCGMFAVVSATDLLTLLVGMELATVPLYALTGFRKECPVASEAATKYIIIGGLSTAVALFGYSFIYGAAGSLHFEAILLFAGKNPDSALLLLGAILVLAGAGFKLTLFPFHMWAPDVYQGAPVPVTAFLSVSSKATAIAFLLVLLDGPLAPLHQHFQPAILLLSGITMTIGNLGALRQSNLLRFMAYSSIAQAGYIVLAFVSQSSLSGPAIFFYLLVYTAANFAVFFIIAVTGRSRSEEMADFRGLGRRNPALAFILMLAMFSLAGIPPLAGFTGKFMLFAAAAREGFHWMVLFAALNSTLSLYYYLLLIKEAYISTPGPITAVLKTNTIQKFSLAPLTGAMLLLGLMPMVTSAIQKIFAG